jgi:hypothetical protein
MDLRPRIAKLQKAQKPKKRPLPDDDSSDPDDQEINERSFKRENKNEKDSEAKLVKFEKGITNRGNIALWYSGLSIFKFFEKSFF